MRSSFHRGQRPYLLLVGLSLAAGAFGASACKSSGTTGSGGATSSSGSTTSTTMGSGGAGGMRIAGLTAPVQALQDPNGLMHLSCKTDDDCFAALGYFHAANRMFFMDFVRNLVRGRLASLVKAGDPVLQKDFANRLFFSTADGKPLEKKLLDDASPEVKGHMNAYTAGVNAWLADMRANRNGATLTREYDFSLIDKSKIRDWEPEDSAAVGLYVLNDLSNNSDDELDLALQVPAYPALAADLFSPAPVFDAYTDPAFLPLNGAKPPSQAIASPIDPSAVARASQAASSLRAALARTARIGSGVHQRLPADTGSNNWCVGPSRTTNHTAILANDPHLVLTNPSIWFGVELDAKTNGTGAFHVAGSTFPGLPSVMVGHNESLGWGVTTAYWDLADVYLEKLTDDNKSVMFNGKPVAIVEENHSFDDDSTGTPVQHLLRWVPHHGPIVSEDDTNHTAVSVRWTGHAGGTDLDAFFGIAKATSVEEAKTAVNLVSSASQNFVIVDTNGSIGWYPFSNVPARPWASASLPPWLPLPGDGSAEWGDPLPKAMLPQLTNPASGSIATANQDMTGASEDGNILNDNQLALQAVTKAEGTREQRIQDLLAAGGNAHSVESLTAIQGDTYSLYGSVVAPAILSAEQGQTLTPADQAVVDALTKWKYTCPTGLDGDDPATAPKTADGTIAAESIGCSAFHATLYQIVSEALGDEVAKAGNVDIAKERWDLHLVVRAIKNPASVTANFWDDVSTPAITETRDDILRRAVTKAGVELAVLGAPDDWRWGKIHTLTLRSIYDSFGLKTYNYGPFAAAGGQYTVDVANPLNRVPPDAGMPPNFEFSAGPSVRFVVEATPGNVTMSYELPGGEDLHDKSPFYNNLLPNWLANKPIQFPFGPGAVPNPAATFEITP